VSNDAKQYLSEFDETDRQLWVFFNRYMQTTVQNAEKSATVFLLFNHKGTLLCRFGQQEKLTALHKQSITEGTNWTTASVGKNAVTTGLTDNTVTSSIGLENEFYQLRKYALYFSPLSFDALENTSTLGGIAILVPAEQQNDNYSIMVCGVTHDLILNLHFRQTTNTLFERSTQGVMVVDTPLNQNSILMTYCSQTLLDMLETKQNAADYNYVPLQHLFDPLPANSRFWSIVKNRLNLTNETMQLTIKGKTMSCTVSTDRFRQQMLQVDSIAFYITNDSAVTKDIAKNIGNNANQCFRSIIGESPGMRAVIQKAEQLARLHSNVLLLGESGVGKDIIAQAIHSASDRRKEPFITINCAAIPRDLIASELFGYDSGAFTGAKKQGNIGKFELANHGTIFLDELGDLPLDLQSTLLRIVEQKQFSRLGSSRMISIDVKIISATNVDLVEQIRQKAFREDLYYRLSTMQIQIPPLRERGDDIVLLAEHFMRGVSTRIGRSDIMKITPAAQQLLSDLSWPGNVRELQNLIECIVQLYTDHTVQPQHILSNISSNNLRKADVEQVYSVPKNIIRHVILTENNILDALALCGNNKCAAARHLGISIRTLYRKIEQLDMKM